MTFVLARVVRTGRPRLVSLIAGSGLGALLLVLIVVAAVQADGACLDPVVDTEASHAMATLDAEHPVVEQEVTLTIGPEALPPDLAIDAARLVVRLGYPTRPELPAAPAPARPGADPPAELAPDPFTSEVTVSFIDLASGAAVARIGLPETTINDSYRQDHAAIPLDCLPQQACERTYLVRIALRDPAAADPLPITWTPTVRIDYTGQRPVPCVPPAWATKISAGEPSSVRASARRDASIEPQMENGQIVARHVTIEMAGARPAGSRPVTVGRLSIRGTDWPDSNWRMWVRIIPDAGTVPLLEGLVGRLWERPHDGFMDVPLLTDCPSDGSCGRGYWLIMQSIPAAAGAIPDGPPNIGQFTWRMDVMSLGSGGVPPGDVSARLDDRALAPDAFLGAEAASGSVGVGQADRDRIVPFTIQLPGDIADAVSDDQRLAGHLVIHGTAQAAGAHLGYRFAGAEIGASNVGRTTTQGSTGLTLIGHPLDACTGRTCEFELRLRLDTSSGSIGPRVDIDWSATLVGFPVGSTLIAGEPIDGTSDPVPIDVPRLVTLLTPFAAAAAIAIVLAARARRLRRRLAA